MRVSRFSSICTAICLAFVLPGCNMPIGFPDEPPGLASTPCDIPCTVPIYTQAIVGFPWEKIDFRTVDELGYYSGNVTIGDSVLLYFASESGANAPVAGLDTVHTADWGVSVQSVADTAGTVVDVRGDTAVAVVERRARGGGMLKPRKRGYRLTPLARTESGHIAAVVYSCRAAECVKVNIVSQ